MYCACTRPCVIATHMPEGRAPRTPVPLCSLACERPNLFLSSMPELCDLRVPLSEETGPRRLAQNKHSIMQGVRGGVAPVFSGACFEMRDRERNAARGLQAVGEAERGRGCREGGT